MTVVIAAVVGGDNDADDRNDDCDYCDYDEGGTKKSISSRSWDPTLLV